MGRALSLPNKAFCFTGGYHQAFLEPEGAAVHSSATLRILASMPSRTIGEWHPLPLSLTPALTPAAGLGWGLQGTCVPQSQAL